MPRQPLEAPEMGTNTEASTPLPPKRRGRPPKAQAAPDIMQSPTRETHSTDFQIGQHRPIADDTPRNDVSREKFDPKMFGRRLSYSGDLILLEVEGKKIEVTPEYLALLAYYETPITIVINPSTHKNAASIFENWSNGVRAEMWINNQWIQVGDLPVGKPITVKRKVVEQIIRARVMNVNTVHDEPPVASPRNEIRRTSSNVHSFSVLRDDNPITPLGESWIEKAYASPI